MIEQDDLRAAFSEQLRVKREAEAERWGVCAREHPFAREMVAEARQSRRMSSGVKRPVGMPAGSHGRPGSRDPGRGEATPVQTSFDSYEEAFAHAINNANKYRQAHGVEKPGTYALGLEKKWTIAMIPNDPAKRFGWERRCQAVEPGSPLSDSQLALLTSQGVAVAPLAAPGKVPA